MIDVRDHLTKHYSPLTDLQKKLVIVKHFTRIQKQNRLTKFHSFDLEIAAKLFSSKKVIKIPH